MTTPQYSIRRELPEDILEIDRVLRRAFAEHRHSQQTEHLIVRRLRAADELVLPHVALIDGRVAGYATFSQVHLYPETGGWYALGPVAVEPRMQKNGIGVALIKTSLYALKRAGAAGCVVLGEPAYYRRFGFTQTTSMTLDGVPPEYFMAQAFKGGAPSAAVSYHASFFEPPDRGGE